jgi:hypothetical protein
MLVDFSGPGTGSSGLYWICVYYGGRAALLRTHHFFSPQLLLTFSIAWSDLQHMKIQFRRNGAFAAACRFLVGLCDSSVSEYFE